MNLRHDLGFAPRAVGVGLALSVTSAGCTFSLAKASSGEIGCPAAEIEIHNNRADGWTRTWTARCRGEVFYCSLSGERQQCSPALPPQAVARRPAPAPPPSQPVREPRKDFPEKALGFAFSSGPEAGQQACTARGHEWSGADAAFACSGAAVDAGLPIKTHLAYCAGELCEVRAFAALASGPGGSKQLLELRKALIAQYGTPDSEQSHIPKECKETLMACLMDGRASWTSTWEWDDDSVIRARAGGDGDGAILGILYRRDREGQEAQEAAERVNTDAF